MYKILLVEDDPMEARLYTKLFTNLGHQVVALENGVECHAKVLEYKPDVILLDIMMPKMNGFDTLDVLHFDVNTQQIPVIVLTNLSDSHYEQEAMNRGAALYITKSNIENDELVSKVTDIISAYAVHPKT